jgi:LmbE family N-acetylglucosaminyl deacetylase
MHLSSDFAASGRIAQAVVVGMLVTMITSASANAAPITRPSAGEVGRAIERLSVVGHVLYVAAHPDDENTRFLAWARNEKLARAAYLSVTRGEGGQNLIGNELSPLLGIIRTQELLAARGVDGAEQLFTRARDFGYSKSADETLSIWDKDAILADVVWNIRRFKPDVIVTRFPPDGKDTHGHHTASAQLALQAFKLAADPNFHAEQLKWTQPWQAKRIVWTRGFWDGNPSPEQVVGHVKMDIGGFNPLLGIGYGEMAAASRSMHKSQGFGASPQRGPANEYFKLLDGAPMQKSILDGVDLSWGRVAGSERLRKLLERARSEWRPADPAASIPLLVEAANALEMLPDSPYKTEKRVEFGDVIAACAGLFVDATAAEAIATPGAEVKITAGAINRSHAPLTLREIRFESAGEPNDERGVAIGKALPFNEWVKLEQTVRAPARLTSPYWLTEPPAAGHFTVEDQPLIGNPEDAPAVTAELVITSGDKSFTLTRPVTFQWTDPVAGERRRPLEVVPPVTANARTPLVMFAAEQPKDVRLTVRASAGAVSGTVTPSAPLGWTVEPATRPFSLARKDDEVEVAFKVRPPHAAAGGMTAAASAVIGFSVSTPSTPSQPLRAVTRIQYPHIPIATVLPKTEIKVVRLELKRTRTRIGYITGAGDDVPDALRQVGYDVTVLTEEQLAHESLSRYEAIMTGVRAFNTNPRLAVLHKRLMDYVAGGGTLVVQYNTSSWNSTLPPELGPYPFSISHDRVTDEGAAVTAALPSHAVLHAPNAIGAHDWDGWVQERGLYFADKWDAKYETPLSMHDPNEPASKGSLLIARHGKGAFIYTGISFFRQLPAGVPGAYRLLSNLLSYGH